jgi:hypothetical protein
MVLREGKYTRGYATVRHGRTRTVRRGVHAAERRCGTPSEEDRVASISGGRGRRSASMESRGQSEHAVHMAASINSTRVLQSTQRAG